MRIICLLLAILMIGPIPIAMPNQTISAVEYVTNNFDEFIAEYNKLDCEDCNATFIEYQTEIYVQDFDTYGYYLDFDGNNGFCIVIDEAVVDIYVTGDYPTLRQDNEYMYDIIDGFLVKDGEEYVPYLQHVLPEVDYAMRADSTVAITDADAYVKKVYGSKYKPYANSSYKLTDFIYYKQSDLSVYYTTKDGEKKSEGNCALSSIYSTLSYLQKQGVYPNLPTTKTIIFTSKDSVKAEAQKQGYTPRAPRVVVPTLYAKIREIAIEKYGYAVDGFSSGKIDELIRDVLAAYGYNTSPSNTVNTPLLNPQMCTTAFESAIKKNLQSGYPVVFTTYQVYGGPHCISIVGYANYRRVYDVGFTKIYRYAKLLVVADNHLAQPTYFDYTLYAYSPNYVHFK